MIPRGTGLSEISAISNMISYWLEPVSRRNECTCITISQDAGKDRIICHLGCHVCAAGRSQCEMIQVSGNKGRSHSRLHFTDREASDPRIQRPGIYGDTFNPHDELTSRGIESYISIVTQVYRYPVRTGAGFNIDIHGNAR